MIETLQDYWHQRPFVPFDLHLANGKTLRVPHPDFFWMSRKGGTIIVSDDEDKTHLVNPFGLVSVTLEDQAPNPLEAAESGSR